MIHEVFMRFIWEFILLQLIVYSIPKAVHDTDLPNWNLDVPSPNALKVRNEA